MCRQRTVQRSLHGVLGWRRLEVPRRRPSLPCRAADTALPGPVLPSSSRLPPQRLQRFSTFGHLKQLVLKIIVDEIRDEMTGAAAAGQKPHGVSRKARTALGNLQVGVGGTGRALRWLEGGSVGCRQTGLWGGDNAEPIP